jgi:hypothetical protein
VSFSIRNAILAVAEIDRKEAWKEKKKKKKKRKKKQKIREERTRKDHIPKAKAGRLARTRRIKKL